MRNNKYFRGLAPTKQTQSLHLKPSVGLLRNLGKPEAGVSALLLGFRLGSRAAEHISPQDSLQAVGARLVEASNFRLKLRGLKLGGSSFKLKGTG